MNRDFSEPCQHRQPGDINALPYYGQNQPEAPAEGCYNANKFHNPNYYQPQQPQIQAFNLPIQVQQHKIPNYASNTNNCNSQGKIVYIDPPIYVYPNQTIVNQSGQALILVNPKTQHLLALQAQQIEESRRRRNKTIIVILAIWIIVSLLCTSLQQYGR